MIPVGSVGGMNGDDGGCWSLRGEGWFGSVRYGAIALVFAGIAVGGWAAIAVVALDGCLEDST